ncbi:MAG: RsmD family RNA methyltransferase [Propionibacteriaceae bacterium]|nr:23S rRNA (adenine(2030)-N(6))-methyltransferase RlmJ [Micropruina sp.]HBX82828.1 hypothetical protein [Propionibacteriaceae bacterium]HBY23424.1 hypothetical protein [Propionibacteriaceae bacterium]
MTRIIAGVAKGRRFLAPTHDRTRPTSDRVREAAFTLIADWAGTAGEPSETQLKGFSFLDLYAGSGGVALEAASRGAEPVRCIESDPGTADLLRRNVRESKLEVSVTAAKVEQVVLAAPDRAWDVVWLDPPYALADTALLRVVVALEAGWLARDGLIVVERASRSGAFPWPGYVHHTWERRYGETTLHFGSPEQP